MHGQGSLPGRSKRACTASPGSPAYRYRDFGTLATISWFRAVAVIGPLRLSGVIAWLIWLRVHLAFLVGFKNRVGGEPSGGRQAAGRSLVGHGSVALRTGSWRVGVR